MVDFDASPLFGKFALDCDLRIDRIMLAALASSAQCERGFLMMCVCVGLEMMMVEKV